MSVRAGALVCAAVLVTAACRDDGGSTSTTAGNAATSTTGGRASFDGPVDIGGGRTLHARCDGEGGPAVILESGYHDASSLWSADEPTAPAVGPSVQARLAEHVRVCSYDRPGTIVRSNLADPNDLRLARDTTVPMPRPASAAVADLHALIRALDLPTPVVIVAHSMGGLLTRLYASTYPGDVEGVVFVDAFPAEMRDAMGAQWSPYLQLLDHPGTPLDADPAFEVFDVNASIDEVLAAAPMPKVPIAVITKTEPFPIPASMGDLGATLEAAWLQTSSNLVTLGDGTPHIFATGSAHYVQVEQPDLVADTALLVIDRAHSS